MDRSISRFDIELENDGFDGEAKGGATWAIVIEELIARSTH